MATQRSLTLPEALKLAQSHHRAGRLQQAEGIYRQILKAKPNHPDANFLMGSLAIQMSNNAAAVGWLQKTLQSKPQFANAHYNLGNALTALGRFKEAVTAFQKVIDLKPDHLEAHINLGSAYRELKRPAKAVESFQQALQPTPTWGRSTIAWAAPSRIRASSIRLWPAYRPPSP
ncbi:MAG: tetratricopeptide repeat protein [Magnetococcales bacterium]|nr:tetratricopeptide repeat protein [Magnetococcales bacterium]